MKFDLKKMAKTYVLIFAILLIGVFALSLYLGHRTSKDTAPLDDREPASVEEEEDYAAILDEKSTMDDEGQVVFSIPKDEIVGFSFVDSSGIIIPIDLSSGSPVYTDNDKLKIHADRVDKMLNYLCEIKSVDFYKDANQEDFGLSQDSPVAEIQDVAGNIITVSFGDYDKDSGELYFALNYDFSTIYKNSGKLHYLSEYSIQDLVAP